MENFKQLKAEPVKYVMGVDTADPKANAYCLIAYQGDERRVILCKTMEEGSSFQEEVNNLVKYFDAVKV